MINQRYGAVLAAILLAVLLISSCSESKEMKRAKEFLDAGMFDQAIILLKQEAQTDPKNGEAHMLLGIAYLGNGMNALAEQELNTATVLDNNLTKEAAKRCYDIAKYLVKTDGAKAHAALIKARSHDPALEKDEQFFFLTYIDTEPNEAARMEAAKKYLTLFPSGAYTDKATYELAEGLLSSGDKTQAKLYFSQVASQFPATEWGAKASDRLAHWTETKAVSVPSQVMWFDTGITLAQGAKLDIRASGQWSDGGQPIRYWGPNGTGSPWAGTIVPSANLDALVGKIGDVTFVVGESFSDNSPASGKLYLSINDIPNSFTNNQGAMNVEVSYSQH
jgi:tetratricopeptide (TPR) repeat protein